ncbi:MAG: hypothetical protein Q8N99_03805 [Nanoarchaeota archaeon]|nr:hypothetical protein [Nanoarchaeota archaeon]
MNLTKYYNALEPQFLCDDCSIAITNPICPFCLTTEIDAWLTLYPSLRGEIIPSLERYLKRIGNRLTEYTICIKCKNKRAAVCPYCFTTFVLKELKKINANKVVIKEFIQFFNFDFEHSDFSKEAEKLGVI